MTLLEVYEKEKDKLQANARLVWKEDHQIQYDFLDEMIETHGSIDIHDYFVSEKMNYLAVNFAGGEEI